MGWSGECNRFNRKIYQNCHLMVTQRIDTPHDCHLEKEVQDWLGKSIVIRCLSIELDMVFSTILDSIPFPRLMHSFALSKTNISWCKKLLPAFFPLDKNRNNVSLVSQIAPMHDTQNSRNKVFSRPHDHNMILKKIMPCHFFRRSGESRDPGEVRATDLPGRSETVNMSLSLFSLSLSPPLSLHLSISLCISPFHFPRGDDDTGKPGGAGGAAAAAGPTFVS